MVYKTRLTIFVLVIVLLYSYASGQSGKHLGTKSTDCLLSSGSCSKKIGNIKLELDISPRPILTMKELSFKVTLHNVTKVYKELVLDLNMVVMDMGLNRITLIPISKGIYIGKGRIVRCRSRHTLWRATITIPGVGSSKFYFNVAK